MFMLCKIHIEKYIVDMFNNEYLFFSSLIDFRSLKLDEGGRMDSRELNTSTTQLTSLKIKTNKNEYELHKLFKNFSGQFNEYLLDPTIKCCSLHLLDIQIDHPPKTYNYNISQMGDKILLIYNLESFFKILDNSIEKLNYQYSRKKVEYYDPKVQNGALTLHHKDNSFEYQNEYRILIRHTNGQNPVKIKLPGLKKISCVIDAKDYNNLRIKVENLNNTTIKTFPT